MKSKIDEVIEEITKEFKRCNADYNGSTDLDSSQVDIVITLEQLQPYVELGEETVKWLDWLKDKSNENWDLKKVHKLNDKIKEQRDDNSKRI